MKPCSKTRSDKSTCANIFLERRLTILFRHYLGMNATSCYWSYIDFYTFITYNYILTDTRNSDTAAEVEFISSPRGVLKNFANFTRKHLCWSLVFTKLQAFRTATLLKKDSEEHLFSRTSERLLLCIDYFIMYWFLQYTFSIFTNKFFFITQLKQQN